MAVAPTMTLANVTNFRIWSSRCILLTPVPLKKPQLRNGRCWFSLKTRAGTLVGEILFFGHLCSGEEAKNRPTGIVWQRSHKGKAVMLKRSSWRKYLAFL